MYMYEHVSGSILTKPDSVVKMSGGPEVYFSGPFIRKWWHVEDEKDSSEKYLDCSKGE